MTDKYVSVPENLIEDIHYHLTCFNRSSDKTNSAHHLIELHNKVGDLTTWHSGYEYEHDTMPWERGERE